MTAVAVAWPGRRHISIDSIDPEESARMRLWRIRSVLAALTVVALVVGCTAEQEQLVRPSQPGKQPANCVVSEKLVPSCGALLGVSVDPDGVDVATLERSMKRKFDLVYEFHGIDKPLPARDEAQLVAEGRILHVNVEAKEFDKPGKPAVAWSRITAGEFDAALTEQAKGLSALGKPVMVTFDHEVDSPKRTGQRGTTEEFVAAWRHIHDLYSASAKNIVWVWVVTGFDKNLDTVPAVYPGNTYVDWVSWDPYNFSGCQAGEIRPKQWKSFAETVRPFYDWLQNQTAGIDKNKPYMLSEFGTVADPDDATAAARWYAEIPAALEKFPQLKAVQLWNGKVEACDYRIELQSETLTAFADVARTPTFTSAAAGLAAR
jgi:hypothetical protein